MAEFVIGRLEPDNRSGCIYWSGAVSFVPHGAAVRMFVGQAVSAKNVFVVHDEQAAHEYALWLNTAPATRQIPPEPLWQVMPLPGDGK